MTHTWGENEQYKGSLNGLRVWNSTQRFQMTYCKYVQKIKGKYNNDSTKDLNRVIETIEKN